jgi:hypothetical protein
LSIYVLAVAYAGFVDQFRPAIPGPTKYVELRNLRNPELRERAFTVAGKLDDLSKKYVARQSEINGQYRKDKEEFDKKNDEYEKAKAEYDRAKASCFSIGGLSITSIPPIIAPSLSASPSLGQLPSISSSSTTCPTTGPQPPPRAPSPPVVSVEPGWAAEAETVQEEAAAVWQEVHHRFGTYARFFDIPRNYSPSNRDLSESAKLLKENANRLH